MMPLPRLLVVSFVGMLVGCGGHPRPALGPVSSAAPLPVAPAIATVGAPEVALVADPIAQIIVKAEIAFEAGQLELKSGRLVAARGHFDAAVDGLLALPEGARADARISAEFDQLLARISALDVLALREGDGLTEARSEPAAIDELLSEAMFERPQPLTTTAETVAADLRRTDYDLDIPVNNKVLSYIELFQGRLHDFMEAGLSRSLRYVPMIRAVFEDEGLPADLAYVPLVESAFKPNALSRASARGMWQFMPGTGRENGLDQTWFVDQRSDPEKATRAAAQYLKSLSAYFDGDWNLALASYNAGPGRIQRAIKLAKTSDYWKLTQTTRFLPRETREYVPMIMAATIIAKNPSLYGFEVRASDPVAYERVTVPNAIDLKIIAEWIGASVDDLRGLNPELRRTTTPMGDHDLKVPFGTGVTVLAKLAVADPSLFVHFNFHTVRRGETLASVAKRYKLSVKELAAANDITTRARVRANQSLMIPQRAASALPAPPAPRAVASVTPPHQAGPLTYRVQRGDTLFRIAKQFDTTVGVIKQLNRMKNDTINVGDRLTVR